MKKIALIGATGNVGRGIAQALLKKGITSQKNLSLYASPNSHGKSITFEGQTFILQGADTCRFDETLCLFATDSDISRKYVPIALEKGACVIDSSSAYRMQSDVPLISAPVNGSLIHPNKHKLYSCPNCIASPLSIVLAPLQKAYGIERVAVSTYQSTSGAGKAPMEELLEETTCSLKKAPYNRTHFKRQIAFNVIPQIDSIQEDGYTKEESKIIQEIQKILNEPLKVTATSVRVPVLVGHSTALSISLKTPFQIEKLTALLKNSPCISLSENHFATPAEIEGSDLVHIGRIRHDPTLPNGLHLWTCSDNLRRGAATDAVEAAELLLKQLI
ncbi:MAG: aspartate-semialdehyde dehydrogenase [Parachlamydiaceae bacterium]